MKTLVVCGDSYMSPVVGKYAGTHFSEIVAERLGYRLIPFSRGGMSNGGICIQVKTALAMDPKPNLILIGNTNSARMEFPINEIEKVERFTVNHILYNQPLYLGTHHFSDEKKNKLVTCSIVNFIDPTHDASCNLQKDDYADQRRVALRMFFEYLYHPDWKEEMDELLLYSIYHQLHSSGIPYIICKEQMPNIVKKYAFWLNYGENSPNYASKDVDNIITHHCFEKRHEDPGYHSTPEAQSDIAETLLKKYIPRIIPVI